MSATEHGLPLLYVAMLWFASTAFVVWLDNRASHSFGASLKVGALLAAIGTGAIGWLGSDTSMVATYASFTAAFAVWGWHELSFLTATVTGPRRTPCPPNVRGWERFRLSAATVIHHEIALTATLALLALISWNQHNQWGTFAFALLFAMRLSTKLNIFLGVPNFSADILPPQLAYLKSYFRTAPFNALMPFSLALAVATTWALGTTALAADGTTATGWTLLTALAALGVVEHLFLVVPLRDTALWRWAIPAATNRI